MSEWKLKGFVQERGYEDTTGPPLYVFPLFLISMKGKYNLSLGINLLHDAAGI